MEKENHRSISFLSHMSKVLKMIMYTQIESLMEDKVSKLFTGFRKKHSTQNCFTNMLKTWKINLDKVSFVCAMFMDLSNTFDTINHDLLIVKLGAYGFQKDALHKKLLIENTPTSYFMELLKAQY